MERHHIKTDDTVRYKVVVSVYQFGQMISRSTMEEYARPNEKCFSSDIHDHVLQTVMRRIEDESEKLIEEDDY